MNDMEELRFGLNTGRDLVLGSRELDDIVGKDKADIARKLFAYYYMEYDRMHAINVYVFCLSEHDPSDNDGKLSMWRAYGSGGNGAAIVFKTDALFRWDDSPLIFAKVDYASPGERTRKLQATIQKWCSIVKANPIADNDFWEAGTRYLFDAIKLIALTSKHSGFSEEEEWRFIYMPERDNGVLKDNISYIVGNRGVEPKLKLKTAHLPGSPTPTSVSLATLLDRIILGPSLSSPLAKNSFQSMLTLLKPELVDRVVASTIPLRPPQG